MFVFSAFLVGVHSNIEGQLSPSLLDHSLALALALDGSLSLSLALASSCSLARSIDQAFAPSLAPSLPCDL